MGRRVKEEGESESRSVIDRIRVEPPSEITLPERGQTSLWSSVTREPRPTDKGRQADMSAAEMPAGAAPERKPDWHSIDWKKVWRTVRRLQARIVKAVAEGRWNKVKALVYLLTHSFAGRALAILRVGRTQQRYVKFRGAGRAPAVSRSDLRVSRSFVCETLEKCRGSGQFSVSQPVSYSMYIKP